MQRIGITERGDAGLHLEWTDRLDEVAYAILITKNISDRFIAEVAKRPEKVVVHVTCTGFGATKLEPRVKDAEWTRAQYDKLIGVLPAAQTVLRIDPVIPTPKGLATAQRVLDLFDASPVTRVRFSLMDVYRHVGARFTTAGFPNPYGANRFQPTAAQRQNAMDLFGRYQERYDIESCAEFGPWQIGCISARDGAACGQDVSLDGSAGQRKACLCPGNKMELLRQPPKPCSHGCLYCYWRD